MNLNLKANKCFCLISVNFERHQTPPNTKPWKGEKYKYDDYDNNGGIMMMMILSYTKLI